MDENKSPQDILNEIFEKSQAPAPPLPQSQLEPVENDPPPAPPPDESAGKRGADAGAKLLPWLCVVLGAALLVMGVCLLQLTRMNHRLDELQQAVEAVRGADGLREENEQLRQNLEELQERAGQAEQENERLNQELSDSYTQCGQEAIKARATACLWYLDQFMQAKDYPMAAAVLYFSTNNYRSLFRNSPAQLGRCQEYRQELIDRGYFQEVPSTLNSQPPSFCFTQQWDPSQSEDMAAMCILWTALEAYSINGAYESAAQFLYLSPLAAPATGYQDRLERLASDFTLRQFQDLKDALVEAGTLAVAEDGAMTQGPGNHTDVLCELPFELPAKTFTQIPVN